jgi:3-oxoacyl-[acyl-carrier protein] reductase
MRLQNKVAIITGGAKGIGAATAQLFAREGAAVAIWDLASENAQATANRIRESGGLAFSFSVNVSDQASVRAALERTMERFDHVDILINNAGILRDARLVKTKEGKVVGGMSEADFDVVMAVNLKGTFNCTQAVVPQMITRRYGRILNASSIVGIYGNFGQTNYVATKAGVIGMTRVWARELGQWGITVNAVAPGFIDTDMTRSMPPRILQSMIERTPVGRLGLPEDVAYAYLYLASDEAAFVNGAVLSVDGGTVVGT